MLETASKDGVLEALAAASARLWNDSEARDVMLVVDVGARHDRSVVVLGRAVGQPRVSSSVAESCLVAPRLGRLGTHWMLCLSMDLYGKQISVKTAACGNEYVMVYGEGSVRRLKETLFETGEITEILVSDHTVTLNREEFVKSDGIKKFEERISDEIQKLLDGVHKSWANGGAGSRHQARVDWRRVSSSDDTQSQGQAVES